MDIPRLDVKGVAVELVNDAIKHAFLTLGYAVATSDQDKAVRVFLQGKDGVGPSLVPSPLPAAIFNGARKVVWHI